MCESNVVFQDKKQIRVSLIVEACVRRPPVASGNAALLDYGGEQSQVGQIKMHGASPRGGTILPMLQTKAGLSLSARFGTNGATMRRSARACARRRAGTHKTVFG